MKKRARKFVVRPEDKLQIDCVALLRERGIPFLVAQPERLNAPVHRRDWFKKLGIFGNAGHPELFIFTPQGVACCELKSARGKFSTEQDEWRVWLETNGYAYHAVTSLDQFRGILAAF